MRSIVALDFSHRDPVPRDPVRIRKIQGQRYEALYLIVSLAQEEPEIRAFRIVEGEVREEELVIA